MCCRLSTHRQLLSNNKPAEALRVEGCWGSSRIQERSLETSQPGSWGGGGWGEARRPWGQRGRWVQKGRRRGRGSRGSPGIRMGRAGWMRCQGIQDFSGELMQQGGAPSEDRRALVGAGSTGGGGAGKRPHGAWERRPGRSRGVAPKGCQRVARRDPEEEETLRPRGGPLCHTGTHGSPHAHT